MEGVCFLPPVLGVTTEHRRGVSTALFFTVTSSFLSRSSSAAQTSSAGSWEGCCLHTWCFMSSLAVTRVARLVSVWWLQSRQVTSASEGPS